MSSISLCCRILCSKILSTTFIACSKRIQLKSCCFASGVTRNYGALDIYPTPALPPLSLSCLPLPIPRFLFPSLLIPSRFPFPPLSPPISNPFLSVPSLCPPSNSYGVWGSALAPPVGSGEARPPNTFLCNPQPKICKFVFFLILPETRRPCTRGHRGLCPPH